MSVLYRALWSDESQPAPAAFVDLARAKFTAWALEDQDAQPLPDGSAQVNLLLSRIRDIDPNCS